MTNLWTFWAEGTFTATTEIHRMSGENELKSGKKNEPKPKLFGPDVFGWGGGLPREGVGAEKFGMSIETREIKLFWPDVPGFCRDIPEVPEKFEKKKFVFIFGSLLKSVSENRAQKKKNFVLCYGLFRPIGPLPSSLAPLHHIMSTTAQGA